jgi:hypothetical protein
VPDRIDQQQFARQLVGNSSGGWVALELEGRTVTALDPAGSWRRSAPRYTRMAVRQAQLNEDHPTGTDRVLLPGLAPPPTRHRRKI